MLAGALMGVGSGLWTALWLDPVVGERPDRHVHRPRILADGAVDTNGHGAGNADGSACDKSVARLERDYGRTCPALCPEPS